MLRNPSLRGMPIAIIQDRDVIAVSYPARQAGVQKYMDPAKVRNATQHGQQAASELVQADGRVFVFCCEGAIVHCPAYSHNVVCMRTSWRPLQTQAPPL